MLDKPFSGMIDYPAFDSWLEHNESANVAVQRLLT
jgi:hypothetical protein